MRLATWNVNSLTARLPRVTEWIDLQHPDVLCMQETKQADDKFPEEAFAELGYESAHYGDGRWNGVAIVSRVGLEGVTRGFGTSDDDAGTRIVSAQCAGTRVFSVYVPNGRALDNEMYEVKLAWLARLRATLDQTCPPGSSVAVCGDFNVAPDDGDVWDPAAFVGATHVSEPERAALRSVEGWGLDDVFRRFNDPGTFTWWDYRAGDFHQGRGLRIDLVLVSDDLVQRATGAFRDRRRAQGTEAVRSCSRCGGLRRLLIADGRMAGWPGGAWPSPRATVVAGSCTLVIRFSRTLGRRQEQPSLLGQACGDSDGSNSPYRRSRRRSRNGTPSQMVVIFSKSSGVIACCTWDQLLAPSLM